VPPSRPEGAEGSGLNHLHIESGSADLVEGLGVGAGVGDQLADVGDVVE
jgi:hypothetical protein